MNFAILHNDVSTSFFSFGKKPVLSAHHFYSDVPVSKPIPIKKYIIFEDLFSQSIVKAAVDGCDEVLHEIYQLEKANLHRFASIKIMIFIEDCLAENRLIDCNNLLNEVDVSLLNSRSLISLVRASFRVKSILPAWETLYARSWNRIIDLRKNPVTVFVGLPKPLEQN